MSTIAVTGSQAGMGLAIRRRLEEAGHRVIGVDLPGHGAEVDADLSNAPGRQAAVAAILAQAGDTLDGLVCNAGVDNENIGLVFGVNYWGVVDLLTGLRPALARAGRAAAVVNVSNSVHITPNIPLEPVAALTEGDAAQAQELLQTQPHWAYQVSKFAVARWLRRHAATEMWAGSGITLNGICPGAVMTDLLRKDLEDPRKREAIMGLPRPIGEFATPEAVGDLVEFLLSPRARFVVGQLIMIDGGQEVYFRRDALPVVWQR